MTSTYIDSGIATADRFLPRLFVADEVRSATVTRDIRDASAGQEPDYL